jgi:hypothetical protein
LGPIPNPPSPNPHPQTPYAKDNNSNVISSFIIDYINRLIIYIN